jgi:hypothetical protein
LKEEARRICALDHTLNVSSLCLPELDIHWESIESSVQTSVAYLRSAKYGIDQPKLFEDVGVYTVDDVLPTELHAEVRSSRLFGYYFRWTN